MTSEIGKLRQRITIYYEATETANNANEPVPDWQPLAQRIPAERLFQSGNEPQQGNQQEGVARHLWRIRFRTDVTSRMKLLDHATGEEYHIESVGDEKGRRRFLILTTKSLV